MSLRDTVGIPTIDQHRAKELLKHSSHAVADVWADVRSFDFKWFVPYETVLFVAFYLRRISKPLDGLFYGAMSGLGFAVREGIYFLGLAHAPNERPEAVTNV